MRIAFSNIFYDLVEEFVRYVLHVGLVVDIDEGEAVLVDGKLDDDSPAASLASAF